MSDYIYTKAAGELCRNAPWFVTANKQNNQKMETIEIAVVSRVASDSATQWNEEATKLNHTNGFKTNVQPK